MTVVFVRVETGVSYDYNTLRTVNSTNSGRSLQRTPFASKSNPSQTTNKVSNHDDAHSLAGSSYARIDTASASGVVLQNLNYSSVTSSSAYVIQV